MLLVGFIGTVIAHLGPKGMSRALLATAFAIVLVPAIALIIGTPAFAIGVVAVFGLHAVFAMLFVGSALLFGKRRIEHMYRHTNLITNGSIVEVNIEWKMTRRSLKFFAGQMEKCALVFLRIAAFIE